MTPPRPPQSLTTCSLPPPRRLISARRAVPGAARRARRGTRWNARSERSSDGSPPEGLGARGGNGTVSIVGILCLWLGRTWARYPGGRLHVVGSSYRCTVPGCEDRVHVPYPDRVHVPNLLVISLDRSSIINYHHPFISTFWSEEEMEYVRFAVKTIIARSWWGMTRAMRGFWLMGRCRPRIRPNGEFGLSLATTGTETAPQAAVRVVPGLPVVTAARPARGTSC